MRIFIKADLICNKFVIITDIIWYSTIIIMKLEKHTSALTELGLNDKEAQTYLALIELGASTVGKLSMATGIKRPNLYLILDQLRERGLVNKIPNSKKQTYMAKDPGDFLDEMTSKISQLERIIPELQAMQSKEETKTLYFEHTRGMKEALNFRFDQQKNRELVGFFATSKDASEEQLRYLSMWSKRAAKNGVRIRGIVPEDGAMREWRERDKSETRIMKEINPSEYSSTVSIDISDSFVRIMSFKTDRVTIIVDRDAAEALKQVFEMLWKRI